MYIYNQKNLPNARALRKDMTVHERILWYDLLRNYPVKFYRQKPVGPYILDFFCPTSKTAIEIDGSQHYEDEALEYDSRRNEYLEKLGIKVLRFDNEDVKKNFDWVHSTIDLEVLGETMVGELMYQ